LILLIAGIKEAPVLNVDCEDDGYHLDRFSFTRDITARRPMPCDDCDSQGSHGGKEGLPFKRTRQMSQTQYLLPGSALWVFLSLFLKGGKKSVEDSLSELTGR
jgi:hypothetical protein